MSWNYRVMRREFAGEVSFGIHEVYYNEDGSIRNWTTDPVSCGGETIEELQHDHECQSYAFGKPVLDWHNADKTELVSIGRRQRDQAKSDDE